ncbi:OmpA family protein [Bacteroidia bacterium]|nr:OmpA family protein [Bacteroidia bacterium]
MIGIKQKLGLLLVLFIMASSCGTTQQANGQNVVSKKVQGLFNEGLKKQSYGDYDEAIKYFKQAIKKEPGYTDAHDALANTYQRKNELDNAISVYKKLLTIKSDHYFALYELGSIYFDRESLDSSAYYFGQFLSVNKTNDRYAKTAEVKIQNISFAKEAMKNPVDITPTNMGPSINTREQEYSPAFSIDEQTLYITRREGQLTNNRPNEDLYYAENIGDNWTEIKNLGPPINTVENEGAFSVSADGHYIFFTSCSRPGGKGQCDIWLTIDKDGKWGQPLNLQSPINTKNWESQPSISSNGRILYFSSDRLGGFGGIDIWKSTFTDSGWSKPVNLGPEINTSKDEQFPFIHSDNVTLYFSSEGHPGMGKSDLFVTHLRPDGKWQKPQNLGYPINTTGYDWNIVVSRDGKTAYYSSDKMPDGKGGLDIYTFELPTELRATQVSYVRGLVRDAVTKKPLQTTVVLTPLDGNATTQSYTNRSTGVFVVPLIAKKQYALTIDKKGYLFHSENFDMPEVPSDKPFEIIVDLQKVQVGKSVVLNNIFFDTDKFALKDESNKELQKLYTFLADNKDLRIEISGHTDNVGDAKYNLELSKNRAKSVYQYLVDQGIASDRLSYNGYGDTQPIADNSNKEGRAANRRTTFTVL